MRTLGAFCGSLSAIAIGLWAWSGAEVLTKSGKSVTVRTVDAFGDPQDIVELRPGPLGGYYLGLDIVGAVIVASLVIIGSAWIVRRMRTRLQGAGEHAA
ncbi:MAG: hypothetical protein IT450_14325 [Phycisphaerales bacterium]|nr:hypothetical protein [Phycisphaerales bacterium]